MATSPISSYSTTRITGLISGLDTETLITKALSGEQSKLDRLYRNKTKLEWKQEAYTGVNTKLSEFRNKFMSTLSPETNVMSPSVYRAYKVNMTENKYFDIKATSSASVGSHRITSATLATEASATGLKGRNRAQSTASSEYYYSINRTTGDTVLATSGPDAYSPYTTLEDLKDENGNLVFDFAAAGTNGLSFTVNGQQISASKTDTMQSLMSKINGAGVYAFFDSSTGKFTIEDEDIGTGQEMRLHNINGPEVFGAGKLFSSESGLITPTSLINEDMTLGQLTNLTGRGSALEGGHVQFTINGEDFFFQENAKISDVISKINASAANVTASFDYVNDVFKIESNTKGEGSNLSLKNVEGKAFGENSIFGVPELDQAATSTVNKTDYLGEVSGKLGTAMVLDEYGMFSFSINGKEFSFNPDKVTLQAMMDKVNADDDARVVMTYSQITDSFIIKSRDTGADSKITFENSSYSNAFGGKYSFFGIDEGTLYGTDARIVIDGEEVYRNTNSFVLDGLEINLKTNFNEGIDIDDIKNDDMISFSVSQDVDSVVEKVKAFINEYNEIVKSFTTMLREEYDYDEGYEPLLSSEKSEMTEEEIELWEAEAKKGLLRNDSMISTLLSKMRTAMFEQVGDTGLSPYDIGISTGYMSTDGQIVFDEAKFRKALEKDPASVGNVMASISESTDETAAYKESGFVARINDIMVASENRIKNSSITSTTNQITSTNEQIDRLLEIMLDKEERYYVQFAQMESLMSYYESQSSWMAQQLSSLS